MARASLELTIARRLETARQEIRSARDDAERLEKQRRYTELLETTIAQLTEQLGEQQKRPGTKLGIGQLKVMVETPGYNKYDAPNVVAIDRNNVVSPINMRPHISIIWQNNGLWTGTSTLAATNYNVHVTYRGAQQEKSVSVGKFWLNLPLTQSRLYFSFGR